MLGGKLLLKREKDSYLAGFCILKKFWYNDDNIIHLLHPEEIKYFTNLERIERKKSYVLGRISAKEAISKIIKLNEHKSIWIKRGGI